MSNSFGNRYKVTVFGQSHSEMIGVVIDGLPAGKKLDMERIYRFMERRAPGRNSFSTERREDDKPRVISGLIDGVTCGAPLCAIIGNHDTRSADYDNIRLVPRPGHSDFTAFAKFDGENDIRGGGQYSGRLTAPICFAGAVCIQLLEEEGVKIGAHIENIAGVRDTRYNPADVDFGCVSEKEFPVIDDEQGKKMLEKIEEAKQNKDSVGGVIECAVTGMNVGWGEPMFDGVENLISQAVFAIPGIKGIEFGSGFGCAELLGSENNDPFMFSGRNIVTQTNNHGGALGGMTSGMPIVFRVAVKPTPSIGKEQRSVNLRTCKDENLIVEGRHDPCIVARAVPCIEAITAIAVMNL